MNDKLKLTIPWADIEVGAQEQIEETLMLGCLKTLAIMPDVHQGYDLPIGSVALLDNHVWPGAVGYDIGCGMCHVNTRKKVTDLRPLTDIFESITRCVPVGFNTLRSPVKTVQKFPNASKIAAVNDAVRDKATLQLGTLGGGNHFIEVGVNSEQEVGLTIHSGSRRPGWLIGDFYMHMTEGPIHVLSDLGQAYLKDMQWALQFALENRAVMMGQCLIALGVNHTNTTAMIRGRMINENHNHAVVTKDGVLHRKGATPAEKGQLGIIPANMRDGVWITRGLGNEGFLNSASHGAGRRLGRKEAKRTLDLTEFHHQVDDVITPDLDGMLDEAPDAYKDINSVLRAQEGLLVDIVDHFKPLIVVKG